MEQDEEAVKVLMDFVDDILNGVFNVENLCGVKFFGDLEGELSEYFYRGYRVAMIDLFGDLTEANLYTVINTFKNEEYISDEVTLTDVMEYYYTKYKKGE